MAVKKNLKITIEKLKDDIKLPEFKTEGAVCADIYLPNTITVPPIHIANTKVVPLGFKMEIPKGYSVRLHLRSSVGRDYPIMLSNLQGIVDEDFRGEVQLFLRNLGRQEVVFSKDMRIAQMELVKREEPIIEEGKVQDSETRGNESGSTGK